MIPKKQIGVYCALRNKMAEALEPQFKEFIEQKANDDYTLDGITDGGLVFIDVSASMDLGEDVYVFYSKVEIIRLMNKGLI